MKKRRICGIVCPLCKDFVFSRARHDMRHCSCGAAAIDGGRDYTKVTWDPARAPMPKSTYKYITQTDAVLVRDWNHRIDKYGIIKANPPKKRRP